MDVIRSISAWLTGGALLLALTGAGGAVETAPGTQVVIARGAEGTEEYGVVFAKQVAAWEAAAQAAGARSVVIGPEAGEKALEQLRGHLQKHSQSPPDRLWLVLIGHGTFDGREAKFNLTGPDLTPTELKALLTDYAGELVFVHSGSAGQPFAKALAGEKRITVSATKSGDEVFYTRFGEPFAEAISGLPAADLDQDAQVSILEAFLFAADRVRSWYEEQERIATEHAILDDNGDGIGTRAEVFEGVRPKAGTPEPVDGTQARRVALVMSAEEQRLSASERRRRDELEAQVEALKSRREQLGEEAYYSELEQVLVELARIITGQRERLSEGKEPGPEAGR